jgi:hypothetical protein
MDSVLVVQTDLCLDTPKPHGFQVKNLNYCFLRGQLPRRYGAYRSELHGKIIKAAQLLQAIYLTQKHNNWAEKTQRLLYTHNTHCAIVSSTISVVLGVYGVPM